MGAGHPSTDCPANSGHNSRREQRGAFRCASDSAESGRPIGTAQSTSPSIRNRSNRSEHANHLFGMNWPVLMSADRQMDQMMSRVAQRTVWGEVNKPGVSIPSSSLAHRYLPMLEVDPKSRRKINNATWKQSLALLLVNKCIIINII